MPFQGHIENGLVVFDERVSLPNGTVVRVELVTPFEEKQPSSETRATNTNLPTSSAAAGAYSDRVRISAKHVKISEQALVGKPEWNRIDYEMGLAVDKFYELEDANTKNP